MPPLRSAATVDRDARVAVDALVDERQRQLERRALVRFGHGERALVENAREQRRQALPQTGGGTIRRVGEHEVVGLPAGVPEERNASSVRTSAGGSPTARRLSLTTPA